MSNIIDFFKSSIVCLLVMVSVSLFSCSVDDRSASTSEHFNAKFTETPLKIDGILDEAVWQKAESYSMVLADDKIAAGDKLKEESKVLLAWDKINLYVGIEFTDSDILAKGQKDNQPHYKLGDVCEIFVKPLNKPWYWEIWATPKSKKTAVFWTRRDLVGSAFGEALEELVRLELTDSNSGEGYRLYLQAAAHVDGTINKTGDNDTSWSCEVAIPFGDITIPGASFDNEEWVILVSRQNFTAKVDKDHRELSMVPKLIQSSFNRYEEYAILKLLK